MSKSLLEVSQEWGVLNWGTWRTLRVPDSILGGQGHPWCHGWPYLTQRKIPWKFCVDNFIISVTRIGGPSWGYLDNVEGSWQDTWRTGSFSMSWMTLFCPKEDTLKVSCWYLYYKCVKNGGSFLGVLGGHWGFLTRNLEDRVILYVMNELVWPKRRYPESFMLMSLLEVCQEGGSFMGVLGGY